MRVLLVIVLGIALLAGGVWMEYQRFLSEPIELSDDSLVMEVERGTSLRGLSEELTERGMLGHPYFFMVCLPFSNSPSLWNQGNSEG